MKIYAKKYFSGDSNSHEFTGEFSFQPFENLTHQKPSEWYIEYQEEVEIHGEYAGGIQKIIGVSTTPIEFSCDDLG